jgi:hypothetical protein
MHPWTRLLGVFVVAVAAALFLKVLPPVIVLVFFVGGVAAVNVILRSQVRRERREGFGVSAGLRRESGDPFGLLGYPFALFQRAPGGRIDEVAWGTWNGLEVKRFDLSWPSAGGAWTRFSCAIAPLGATCPSLVVEAKTFSAVLPAATATEAVVPGLGPFSGAYAVHCDDASFARTLLDERIVEWLGGLDEPWGFEVGGGLVLAYGPAVLRGLDVLERLNALLDLVPAEIRSGSESEADVAPRPDAESP